MENCCLAIYSARDLFRTIFKSISTALIDRLKFGGARRVIEGKASRGESIISPTNE